jgi:hypothetical protein
MKTIPLTDNEINHIKEVYSQELERLQKRTHEISTILKKLQGKAEVAIEEKKIDKIAAKPAITGKRKYTKKNAVSANTEKKTKGKRGRPAKIKTEAKAETKTEAKVVKKRGRKPKDVKPVKTIKAAKPAKVAKTAKATAKTAKAKTKVEKTAKAKTSKTAKTAKAAKTAKPAKAVKATKTAKPVKAAKTAKAKTAKTAKAEKSVAEKGKRGRKKSENSKKSRWTTTIIELLEGQGKLLSSRAIVDEVMKSQNIPTTDYSKTRSIIAGSLSDLVLETKRLKTIPIRGQKGNLYGLTQWFDNSGNILDKNKMQ